MPRSEASALSPMVSKLQQWRPLDEGDQDALLALPCRVLKLRPQEYVVREGDRPQSTCLMLSGYSIRHKVAGNGGRQIFSIHMKGDLADLHNSLLGMADHNLQALTHIEVAQIPVAAIHDIAFARPAIGRAMWYETLVDSSIFREWTLNVGRRNARTRTAHLLCEFSLRLELAGLGERCHYELPMTQEQLADAWVDVGAHQQDADGARRRGAHNQDASIGEDQRLAGTEHGRRFRSGLSPPRWRPAPRVTRPIRDGGCR